jgi:hypothetical protein
MIKNNYIRIKVKGCRKLAKFKQLGYDITGEYIDLKVEHLNIGSRELVSVICDFCNREVSVYYKEYLRNISIGNKYSCSVKCGSYKAKETNIKNIGVESHMMLKETQEKTKKTNLERYGVEFPQQSESIKQKSRKTLVEKWGVDHISKSNHFKTEFKKTCMRNLGVEYPMQSNIVKEKSKQTLVDNYKVDNPSKSSEIRLKIVENNLKKYGITYPQMLVETKEKTKLTNIEKYGVNNITRNEYFRKNNYKIASDLNYIKYLNNGVSLLKCDCEKDHHFEIQIDNYLKRKESNLPLCTICHPIGDRVSIREKEIYEFIKSVYKGEIIQSYRDGLEIDIYLPHLKLGFEFNGLYWHSEEFKDKWYHLDKTNHFKERGIRIIHIWEDDWLFREDIIKSQIKNWLGLNNIKISARKCVIREIDNAKIFRKFLDSNHIQGYSHSVIKLGLFYNGELVSLMTFEQSEGRERMPENEWNLSRFCNKLNTSVIGGASKLLIYFIKTYKPSRIISYADKDWSTGYLYEKLGFKNIKESRPDYKYIIDNRRVNKSRYRKSKLNTTLSESKEMKFRNIQKIWDCGKIKFELILNFNLN